jgi:EmrB/QacA subfamily drug resistance transporter
MTEPQHIPDPRRWQALAVVCTAFFMTILDVSIVNVALPSIKKSLDVSDSSLQWVLIAYAITFGGFLLLGGRLADLLGRRRIFMAGVALFSVASLACGLANTIGVLVAARAVQGLGAALVSPATLSIITTTFEEGAERNKALGIWGAMGGSGAAAGVLFGGLITNYLGWEWIFFVNVPVGIVVLLLTTRIVRESRIEGLKGFDIAGAVTATASLALLTYAVSKAPDVGWGTTRTIGELVAAGVLMLAFVFIERRVENPLVPFRIFRVKSLTGANVTGILLGGVVYANFFLLTLYVQQVLGYSALKTGLTFLATAGTVIPVAGASQALTTRIGPRPVLATGMLLITAAMVFYTQIPVEGTFASNLLIGYLLMGVGMAFAFIPMSIAALGGVVDREAGLASGLINTSQQVGGALGVAIASTVAFTHATNLLKTGSNQASAYTSGFALAFWVLAGLSGAGIVTALVLVRSAEPAVDGEPVEAASL